MPASTAPATHQASSWTCSRRWAGWRANGLQLGAVCVGLWEGNCAKVLLGVWFKNL
jgi:hypothetical protein